MRRLLVANRGEIARRIFRTAHRMGMETVAVYSDADADALHVREATSAQALGGAGLGGLLSAHRQADCRRARERSRCNPSRLRLLSENAEFAQAVLEAGLAWVGPPPEAIRKLGNKAAAKLLAQELGVPCCRVTTGKTSRTSAGQAGARIGFPLMVKAAAGGGGRGMRLVTGRAQLPRRCRARVPRRYPPSARASCCWSARCCSRATSRCRCSPTATATVSTWASGDCSVQRGHQKIVEETPSPGVDAALRRRMGDVRWSWRGGGLCGGGDGGVSGANIAAPTAWPPLPRGEGKASS
jgi:3-methylcrotonyl-CoA carboxylase alpha subunit/geranyl-CoA carboxylase alpha subunit